MAYHRTLKGTGGHDYYRGDDYGEKLIGLGGDDDIGGGGGDDLILGGDGNDLIEGGFGNDILIGGDGIDAVSYAYAREHPEDGGVQVDLESGVVLDFADRTHDLIHGFEVVIGSNYADTIIGWKNNDDLRGGAGGDLLYGGAGDDTLRGDTGDDRIDGEAGFDFVDYFYGAAGTISLRAGEARLLDGDHDTIRNVEGVHGSQAGDTIVGDGHVNELWGELGDDLLRGGSGDDRLNGGAGHDRLIGGVGADIMSGGTDADRFIFGEADTAVRSGGGPNAPTDVISDFSRADGDRIVLRGIDANTGTERNDAFHWLGDAAFSGHAGELRAVASDGVTLLEADRNGDGTADLTITLLGEHALVASDFVL